MVQEMFFCVYVGMFCHTPEWACHIWPVKSGLSTTYSIDVCRPILIQFTSFLEEETHFPPVCGDLN